MTRTREEARRTARRAIRRAKESGGDAVAWALAMNAQRYAEQTPAYVAKGVTA